MVCTIINVRILSPYESTHLRRYKPALLQAVEQGEFGEQPVEYITGKVEFAGLLLKVNPAVLIPRVETEELVERSLYTIQKLYRPAKKTVIVDVGTGSGAIGLSIWSKCQQLGLKNIKLYLMDISLPALAIARENLSVVQAELRDQGLTQSRSQTGSSITFLHSDLLGALPVGIKIDVLLANLPYIPSARVTQLAESVRAYEPLQALDGGVDGLELIHQLLNQATHRLNKKGVCWLEIDDTHTTESIRSDTQLLSSNWQIETFTDCFGKMRFARCYLGAQPKK